MNKASGDSPLAMAEKDALEQNTEAHHRHGWRDGIHPVRIKGRNHLSPSADNLDAEMFTWKYMISCEARNALQVILSGAEILLDQQPEALSAEQRMLLERMNENALHLANLVSALTKPEERPTGQKAAPLHSFKAIVAETECEEL
jgi:signal transduction histidine kinase